MLSLDALLDMIDGLNRADLDRWMRQGWVLPVRERNTFLFREIDVARIRLIIEIRTDLQLDEEAVPIVLSLLDQIYGLRRELRQVMAAVDAQSEEVRQAIRSAIAAAADAGES